jgi:catechol 2,3-dioxygenase-like lactoylglutathione lyase family enzyme
VLLRDANGVPRPPLQAEPCFPNRKLLPTGGFSLAHAKINVTASAVLAFERTVFRATASRVSSSNSLDFCMHVQHILETCLYVDDLSRAERFYHQVLGLVVESRQEGRHVFFHCGKRMLLLFNPLASRESTDNFPGHGAIGPGHVAFAIRASDTASWIDHLKANDIAIEKTIDWPQGGRSIYFRDPAGNSLELATPQIWGLPD